MYEPAVYESLRHAPSGAYHRVPGGWAASPAPEPTEGRKRYQPHDVDPSLFGSHGPVDDDSDDADPVDEDDAGVDGSTGVDSGSTLPPAS